MVRSLKDELCFKALPRAGKMASSPEGRSRPERPPLPRLSLPQGIASRLSKSESRLHVCIVRSEGRQEMQKSTSNVEDKTAAAFSWGRNMKCLEMPQLYKGHQAI